MSPGFLALLAAVVAVSLAPPLVLGGGSARLAWTVAGSGVVGLILALFDGSTRPPDLATVVGVVLIGGAPAGLPPAGRRSCSWAWPGSSSG
jgi:hypothetical protein